MNPSSRERFAAHVTHKTRILREAMQHCGLDRVIIASGTFASLFRDDQSHPYRANPYFVEFTALEHYPGSFLCVDAAGHCPTLFLKREKDYWHSAAPEPDDFLLTPFEVREFYEPRELRGVCALQNSAIIGPSPFAAANDTNLYANPESLLNWLDFFRAIKTDWELDCMRSANRRAAPGHRAAAQAFEDGASELQIHLAYLQAIGSMEADLPYPNIVALNENAATLHHGALQNVRATRHSLLIDAGAKVRGYAADITRTHAGPDSDPLFGELIAGVDGLQQELVAQVKAGIDYLELHLRAHAAIAKLLTDIDVLNVAADIALELGITRSFFPHGVGHLLGVQVHERGGHFLDKSGALRAPPTDHPFLRCTRLLEKDMVVTVEPGVYFIPQLMEQLRSSYPDAVNWALVERLSPCGGVRIEDDVAVTGTGAENLTRNAFALPV